MNDQDKQAIFEAYTNSNKTPLQIVEEYMIKKNKDQLNNDIAKVKFIAKLAFTVLFILCVAVATLLIASV